MGLLDQLREMGGFLATVSLKQTLLDEKHSQIAEEVRQLRTELRSEMQVMGNELRDLRERVKLLEATRQAEKREIEALITRFQLEVERAQLQSSRQLPPPATT